MKEFFVNLKQLRENKGITLEEISRKSRLALKYLKEIENGNLQNLPQGYDRIFFKRYLKEIGEDKDEVWRDFNLFFGTGPLQKDVPYSTDIPPSSPVEDTEETETPSEEPEEKTETFLQKLISRLNLDKIQRYFWIVVTLVILSIVGYFAIQQYLFVRNSPPEIREISVSEYINEMQERDSLLTPKIAKDTEVKGTKNGDILVELHSLNRTWVREIRDQNDTTEYILVQGLKRKISANQSVKLMLGRADGVQIWLNGDSLGVMGKANEVVVNLLLTHEGVVEKKLRIPAPRNESLRDSSRSVSRSQTPSAEVTGETLTSSPGDGI